MSCVTVLCFFSDCVTHELKILKNTKYISLKKSSKEWSDIILEKLNKYKRTKVISKLDLYDIKKQAASEINSKAAF